MRWKSASFRRHCVAVLSPRYCCCRLLHLCFSALSLSQVATFFNYGLGAISEWGRKESGFFYLGWLGRWVFSEGSDMDFFLCSPFYFFFLSFHVSNSLCGDGVIFHCCFIVFLLKFLGLKILYLRVKLFNIILLVFHEGGKLKLQIFIWFLSC